MTRKTGKNKDDLKRLNRSLILKLAITSEMITRTELTEKTGLSKMAISSIVSDLISKNILQETETTFQTAGIGRYAKGIKLSPLAPKIIGVSITRSGIEVVLGDFQLKIIDKATYDFPPQVSKNDLKNILYKALDTLLDSHRDKNVVAIGLTSVGPISREKGLILSPYYFHEMHDIPVVSWLQEHYSLPVFFNHDNQSAVLADSIFGQAKHFNDILYVGVANGVGCGIMIDGELYDNRRGLPPEFGHISIDRNGDYCMCGNRGCIETYLRTPIILNELALQSGRQYHVEDLLDTQDPYIKVIFKSVVEKLTTALVSLINILNSELIILGSDANYWPDYVLEELGKKVNEARFVAWDQEIPVIKSTFGSNAVIYGAMCNAINAIFEGRLLNDI